MYKVGDRVRIINPDGCDESVREGDIFEVVSLRTSGYVRIKTPKFDEWPMRHNQIKKVEESKEMTFPEMAQKLIDGEFEVGTELTMTDEDDYKVTFYVLNNIYGYGISTANDDFEDTDLSYPSYMNGAWTVKEQPIKEMSIGELQKELGYKIKIVEHQSK